MFAMRLSADDLRRPAQNSSRTAEVDRWSRAHPDHLPIMITINAADRIYTHTVPRLDVAGALAALCTTCNTASVTGWWWNPAEPGRGFSIETRNGRTDLELAYQFGNWIEWGPVSLAVFEAISAGGSFDGTEAELTEDGSTTCEVEAWVELR